MSSIEYTQDIHWRDALHACYLSAEISSHDPKTRNGAKLLLVGGGYVMGANHFPKGIYASEHHLRPDVKGPLIVHAECDVIYKAAQYGLKTLGSTLVCCWAPCIRCASAIIQAGVARVVTHKQMHERTYEKYAAEIETAIDYLHEAGVQYLQYDGKIGDCVGVMNGERWSP